MVDITDIVTGITNKRVKELAEQMRDEMKAMIAAGGHIKTGKAYRSIEVRWNQGGETGAGGTVRGGFITSVFIGSDELSAYYLDEGNGGSGSLIYPTHSRNDGTARPPMLGEYPGGIPGYGWRPYVHGYDGIHFARKVADRHR